MRRSLVLRMLAVSILVAVASIAATAWLAALTASGGIRQQQSQSLADDTRIYTTLLDYAATQTSWTGVQPTVTKLEHSTGRTIELVTKPGSVPQSRARASAVIDPLAVDPVILPNAPADRIDPDAVGPYRLTAPEKSQLDAVANDVLACLNARTAAATLSTLPSGRPIISDASPADLARCGGDALDQPTASESAALTALDTLVNACLSGQGVAPVAVGVDFSWSPTTAPITGTQQQTVRDCITSARKTQLADSVAPSALLFVTSDSGTSATTFDLSSSNQLRIAAVAGGVLLLTVVIAVIAGTRLTRPLRALTAAAQSMARGETVTPVPVRGDDELARLAVAFNEMTAAREAMERQRRAMTSDIAHELRTPLSNIRGWLEAARDGIVTGDAALAASLLEEAMLLQHIIDDLQDLAMADAGRLRLETRAVPLAGVLDQVAAAHAVVAEAAGIRLSLHVDGDPVADADPLRLRQILDNLVRNALRYTPAGGSVSVHAHTLAGTVVINVADTGIGISADELPHVFDRFWRAEKSRNRETGGSGLGLSIVRRLAEAHGGDIAVTSTPGAGSIFRLTLPAAHP